MILEGVRKLTGFGRFGVRIIRTICKERSSLRSQKALLSPKITQVILEIQISFANHESKDKHEDGLTISISPSCEYM